MEFAKDTRIAMDLTVEELQIIKSGLLQEYNKSFGNLGDDESFEYFDKVGNLIEKINKSVPDLDEIAREV